MIPPPPTSLGHGEHEQAYRSDATANEHGPVRGGRVLNAYNIMHRPRLVARRQAEKVSASLSSSSSPASSSSSSTTRTTLSVVILISGRGSNMEAIIRAVQAGRIPNVSVRHVISNVADAPGMETARRHGIECSTASDMGELATKLRQLKPDIICMAGFMRIVPPEIVREHTVLNIHPSLLPMYPGLHAQRQALEDDAKWSGCTVHYADEGVDTGPIIVQYAVPVRPDDTEESLSGRILEKEHVAYPHAVMLVAGRIARERAQVTGGGASTRQR